MMAKMNWAVGVLIGVDQLGNAIAAGNPDSTISARVGYFADKDTCSFQERCIKYYWLILEWVINFAFLPIDGPVHCLQAYKDDSEATKRGQIYLTQFCNNKNKSVPFNSNSILKKAHEADPSFNLSLIIISPFSLSSHILQAILSHLINRHID